MKKFLLFVLLFVGIGLTGQAQRKFYYYPTSNVYYDVAQQRYVYQKGSNWTPVTTLPSGINLGRSQRYIVYSQTPEVWNQNQIHVKKYKAVKTNTPNGKAVGYKGTNSNKALGKSNGKGNGKGKH
ncbi:MAG: hypothetical protein JWQ96_3523 [Segetibacter sp.]|nr:hypothetical protein [Segetibacter sp.]